MFKRVLMIGVLAVGLFAMRGSEAKAHLAGTQFVPTYRHISSYDCTGTFGQVPNLEQHPAFFECSAVVRAFEVVCKNPKGKIVTPGIPSGPRTVTQFAEDFITEDDQSLEDKTRGRAKKTLTLPDTVLQAGNAICADRNRNWTAAAELVLAADVWLRTFDCTDPDDETCADRVRASEALLHCTLPAGYSILPNNLPATPLDYDCTLLAERHCDQGDACPITLPLP